ncbi:recombinase family protein [Streptomyces sp. CAU 1734]
MLASPSGRSVTRCGIYCRLSYAPDGSLEKVEQQEGDCRDLAARLSWVVSDAHVFQDNSRSAWQRNRKRPAWDRMLSTLEAGEIDAIIVYHGDRLIRQPFDLEKLISVADQKGIRIASPSGTRNLDSPDDRFVLRIEAAQACRESDNTSRRVTRGLVNRAEKGRASPGGRRAFGWGLPTGQTRIKVDRRTGKESVVPVLDFDKTVPEETKILADVSERLLAGMTKKAAVQWMNQRCRTTSGGLWIEATLTRLLEAPRTAGLVERDGVYFKAVWEGPLSVEAWEDLKALFAASRQANPYRGRTRRHLLPGVAECSSCHVPDPQGKIPARCWIDVKICPHPHRTVKSKPSGTGASKSQIYFCPQCGRARNEPYTDEYVVGHVLRLLNDPRLLSELQSPSAGGGPGPAEEIVQLEQRRARLAKQVEDAADDPDVDPFLAMKAISGFDRKIAGLRATLATTAQDRLILRAVGYSREQWEAEPIEVRSDIVGALFRVAIKGVTRMGKGFDPSSVEVFRRTPDGATRKRA